MSSQIINSLETYHFENKISSSKYPVYKAIDTKTNKEVAVKLFPRMGHTSLNFQRETGIFSQLKHKNIISMNECQDSAPTHAIEASFENASFISLEYAAHGDLFEIVANGGPTGEKLARTLFHQLFNGIKHMHCQNIAHLDLKIENLLLTADLSLKVTDFDLSQKMDDDKIEGRGTPGYRGPEVKNGSCKLFDAADVYSMAVILFVFMTGIPPYSEVDKGCGPEFDPFYKLMRKNANKFWDIHAKHQGRSDFFSDDFKNLVNWMLSEEARERPSLQEIENHPWFKGETFSDEEYQAEMTAYLKKAKKI
eukprot:CAMPEP_0114579442 /NCGR_PEP_ID=MMETSP0125-20121206/3809_1 /TAXON_ID=485358 ORGANISM="Aristerostoma sp., Strain ATCC 50986" /NCGR_SAMPLE_ID=MMETSP0125 /ASSEMBLY_ACC=CAM_ASM_000245 /LENGTH=307 /DNA_ID=CAMNT_0001770171 /DNA_START=65 /DNA_END=985 /DNA_ORIENTATION=+